MNGVSARVTRLSPTLDEVFSGVAGLWAVTSSERQTDGVSRLATRAVVFLSVSIGLFALVLVWLGSLGTPVGASVLSAAGVGVVVPWLIARSEGVTIALATSSAWSLVLGLALGLSSALPPLTTRPSFRAVMLLWLLGGSAHAVFLAPIACLLHREAPLDTGDAIDRALRTASLWLGAVLTGAIALAHIARLQHAPMAGGTEVLVGPALASLWALSCLSALAALAFSARWLRTWRRVLRGGEWRLVPMAEWAKEVPRRPWFHIRGATLDAVVVRDAAPALGAYREPAGEVAHSVVPSDRRRVSRRLIGRMAASIVLLSALTALALGPLAALRW